MTLKSERRQHSRRLINSSDYAMINYPVLAVDDFIKANTTQGIIRQRGRIQSFGLMKTIVTSNVRHATTTYQVISRITGLT